MRADVGEVDERHGKGLARRPALLLSFIPVGNPRGRQRVNGYGATNVMQG